MGLDHDSGAMDGEVLTGRFAGAWLSQLSDADLDRLAEDLEADLDSLGLLLAFRERRGRSAPRSRAGRAAAAGRRRGR